MSKDETTGIVLGREMDEEFRQTITQYTDKFGTELSDVLTKYMKQKYSNACGSIRAAVTVTPLFIFDGEIKK